MVSYKTNLNFRNFYREFLNLIARVEEYQALYQESSAAESAKLFENAYQNCIEQLEKLKECSQKLYSDIQSQNDLLRDLSGDPDRRRFYRIYIKKMMRNLDKTEIEKRPLEMTDFDALYKQHQKDKKAHRF